MKTILAMPVVLDGMEGRVEVEARGHRHLITLSVDRSRQEPLIKRTVGPSGVRVGTIVRLHWPVSASSILADVTPLVTPA